MRRHRSTEKVVIPEEHVLLCRGITKSYFQGESHIKAVDNAFLTVKRGEFVAITGTSGSGKSTLLHILAGLDEPSSGKVYIAGKDLFDMTDKELSTFRAKRIGFIFQSFHLLPVLTAKENILMAQKLAGGSLYPSYLDELARRLKIDDRLHHLPGELSGGQQQRVAVARALINRPDILFADEPTGNLDEDSSNELIRLLLTTREELHQTLVMVTHDPAIAKRADRVLTMANGVLK